MKATGGGLAMFVAAATAVAWLMDPIRMGVSAVMVITACVWAYRMVVRAKDPRPRGGWFVQIGRAPDPADRTPAPTVQQIPASPGRAITRTPHGVTTWRSEP